MRISEQFQGNYFKASDLPQPRVLTITAVVNVQLDSESKVCVQFAGEQQQLIANKTNSMCMAEWFGDDTSSWPGKQVELYSATTDFGGRRVPCIRVRQPQPAPWDGQQPSVPQQQPVQAVQQQPVQAVQQPAQQPAGQPAPQQQVQAPNIPLDA